ncbi:K+-H+ exchange-like protein isoform X2 [Wolffia australiana]
MRARLVVFPIKGRNWCFSRSVDPAPPESTLPSSRSQPWNDLWKKLFVDGGRRTGKERVELIVDFAADKMHGAWVNLENAPAGSMKNKIHGLGLKLLSRVEPSETFLRSVSEDITKVDITYPSRGSINHRIFFYTSVSLIPFTAALSVLPLPNIPFFWLLFRAFANWRALKGSERLLLLVSDSPEEWRLVVAREQALNPKTDGEGPQREPWTLWPCEKLENLVGGQPGEDPEQALRRICDVYRLNETEVLRCRQPSIPR